MLTRALLSPAELAHRLGAEHLPTPEQEQAVCAPLGPWAVVAGAGSGKTQTMGLRVVWLVANGAVEPSRVLGLTFTRKAAGQLGDRLRRMLRALLAAHERDPFLDDAVVIGLRSGEPTVSTYHAYAAGLVVEHALRLGLEPATRLLGDAVTWQVASAVTGPYDGPMDAVDRSLSTVTPDVLALAADLAEHLVSPEELLAFSGDVLRRLEQLPAPRGRRSSGLPKPLEELRATLAAQRQILELVRGYARLKRARGAMDYGDQVAFAARVARDDPAVGQLERARWAAVLLDEYQDTGEAQRVLLTSLYGGGHPVTAVGDPRQAIYGWRGASAGNLERFTGDFRVGPATEPPAVPPAATPAVPPAAPPAATRVATPAAPAAVAGSSGLTRCFRGGEHILAVANRVGAGIPVHGLQDRPLVPGAGREGAGRVLAALHESVDDEAVWIAEQVAALPRGGSRDGTGGGTGWGQVAVLARKRSQFPRIEVELRRRGVPCEVVGLGGLLLEPEVVDVVSVLRVLADPSAGSAVVRLLTGPRWRIGPRDLVALAGRAAALVSRRSAAATGSAGAGSAGPGSAGPGSDGPGSAEAEEEVGPPQESDLGAERSLVDALDDLGRPEAYSPEGYRRMSLLRDELRELRRLTAQPLPDLVGEVARTLCLDVELASHPGVRPADALVHLDRLLEVAEEFADGGDDPGLAAFLAYLDAAEERERGLEPDVAEPDGERVQLLTVHAAKGLEWDAVVVAGMTRCVFPVEGQPVADWTRQAHTLPFPLRGDAGELPVLDWPASGDPTAVRRAVEEFREACRARARVEERRLAYVAVTRARHLLICSGYWWDTTTTPRGPSEFLTEVREVCRQLPGGAGAVGPWLDEPRSEINPVTARQRVASWPVDPIGAHRAPLERAAALVRAAADAPAPVPVAAPPGKPSSAAAPDEVDPALAGRAAQWRQETDLLLAELAGAQQPGREVPVALPARLSVSQLVALRRDPAELARVLRRPLPEQPRPLARRGTRFHLWLEQRWGQQRLLDVDELPGAADESAEPDADLRMLQDAFRASPWWQRTPAEVEFPFDMLLAGVGVRGRIDAVFTDSPDGRVDVVDWKTGAPPRGAEASAVAVQLAAYRLAWHELTGIPLHRIRAAFHYVPSGHTVRPVDLLDREALERLVRSVPEEPALARQTAPGGPRR